MTRSLHTASFRFGYRLTPWVKRLLLANTVIFILMWAGFIPLELAIDYLAFNEARFLTQPWTIITYMFIHGGPFHVFFNMLMLFFFGPPLEERWGGKEFMKYYLICGVGGALFNVIFSEGTIIGASGAIYGVMLAYALNWPESLVWIYAIFPIKVKYLVLFLGAMSFLFAFQPGGGSDGIAHFAHLGGLVVGFVYLKKGWQLEARWKDLKKRFRKRKFSVVPGGAARKDRGGSAGSSSADEEARTLEVVDALLDKIAAHGIESLTPEERRFLDEVSRRRQQTNEVH
jgi:membrane associated rhomboid family serine protease